MKLGAKITGNRHSSSIEHGIFLRPGASGNCPLHGYHEVQKKRCEINILKRAIKDLSFMSVVVKGGVNILKR